MAFEPINQAFNLLNPPSNFQIKTPRPIIRFHCLLEANVTAAAGSTQKALGGGIRAYLRKVLWSRGGSPIQTWGTGSYLGAAGWSLSNVLRGWLRAVEQIVDVPAAPGGTVFDMRYAFVLPTALPPEHYSVQGQNLSAIRVKPKATVASDQWSLDFQPGDVGDLLDTIGASAINSATVKVVAETDETLDSEMPDDGIILYSTPHAIPLSIAPQTDIPFDLPRDGMLLNQAQLAYNDEVLTNTMVTKTKYIFNTTEILSDEDYLVQQAIAALNGDAAANYPDGLNFLDWDSTHDLRNAINVPAATGWQIKMDHIQPTTRGDWIEQMQYVLPAAVAFSRIARG